MCNFYFQQKKRIIWRKKKSWLNHHFQLPEMKVATIPISAKILPKIPTIAEVISIHRAWTRRCALLIPGNFLSVGWVEGGGECDGGVGADLTGGTREGTLVCPWQDLDRQSQGFPHGGRPGDVDDHHHLLDPGIRVDMVHRRCHGYRRRRQVSEIPLHTSDGWGTSAPRESDLAHDGGWRRGEADGEVKHDADTVENVAVFVAAKSREKSSDRICGTGACGGTERDSTKTAGDEWVVSWVAEAIVVAGAPAIWLVHGSWNVGGVVDDDVSPTGVVVDAGAGFSRAWGGHRADMELDIYTWSGVLLIEIYFN